MPTTDQILSFNRIPTAPLGILPHLPITLGGKNVCIDFMVVKDLYIPILSFNVIMFILLKVVVSTLFRVMHFPHYGKIVTIDQLSFFKIDHRINPSH